MMKAPLATVCARILALPALGALASMAWMTTSCRDAQDGAARGGLLEPPAAQASLALEPMPMPPAVTVAPGAIAGIPAGPVAVVVARPQGPLTGAARPALTFNKPLVALGDREATSVPLVRLEPAAPGSWRWVGSSSIEFVPEGALPWATAFTVTVDAGLKAVDGATLEAPYSFAFETLRPALQSTSPIDGWRWLGADGRIELVFNMPVKDLASHLEVRANGRAVPITVSDGVDVEAERARARGRQPSTERSEWGTPTRYTVTARGRLAPGTPLEVELRAGLRAAEGTLAMEQRSLGFNVAGPMAFTGVRACERWRDTCPSGPVVLMATNEPDVESLKGRVRFEPPAVVDEDELSSSVALEEGAMAVVSGRFRPGTTYKVIVDAGVKDMLGQGAPAFVGEVTFSDVEPDLVLPGHIVLIESGGDDTYPVETLNVQEVRVEAEALTPAQMAVLTTGKANAPVDAVASQASTLRPASERNVAVRTPVPLAGLFAPGTPRLFRLGVSARNVAGGSRTVLGQITDLAAHAKLGATSSVAWVTSLSKGTPVEGARVQLYDTNGKAFAEATTDADGIARLPGLDVVAPRHDDSWRAPSVLVAAEKDGDVGVAASGWDGDIGPWAHGVGFSWQAATEEVGVLVTERGIYRPGDEVFIKGVLRLWRGGRLVLPELGSKVEVRVAHQDRVLGKEQVAVSRFGTVSSSAKLPADAALGWYSAELTAQVDGEEVSLRTTFRVEEYRAPRFKVDVTAPRTDLVAGEALTARAEARYLFGAPMPGAEVEATVLRTTLDFEPPGLERWRFGIHTWGFDDGDTRLYGDIFARRHAVLGQDGAVDLVLGVAEAPARRPAEYVVEAEVADVSRQRVANRTRVVVHPAAVYAGVRVGDGFGDVGKPLRVEAVAARPDGTRVSGAPLEVAVKRRSWKSIRKRDPYSGRYETLSEPEDHEVSRCTLKSRANEAALCELVPDTSGMYVVEATVTDDKGRTQTTSVSTYVVGAEWVSWQRTDGALLELVPDRARYEPGQTARVLVKSPWPEAEALITLEREGVITSRRQRLVGSATAIDVPIDEAAIPNVFVSVLLVRGRMADAQGAPREIDPGRPQVRAGYARLAVQNTSKRLDVNIDTSGTVHRPGEKVTLKVAVRDAAGKGRAAEVALWAVDEAVLRLTDYVLENPLDAIFAPRALSVALAEPLVFLLRRQGYGEKGRPPGGDGDDGAGMDFRSNFKTTAFFMPSIVTNERGEATVEVTLPDDLTTYRVLALAVTEGDLAGNGKAELVVQKPLVALPALPRLARVGDRFEAGVVVNARSDGEVQVSAEVTGLKLEGPAQRTVRVVAGRSQEVRFPFVADAAGRARLRFRVQGGGESDGVEQLLPVVLPMVLETVAASGDTTDTRTEALAPPSGVMPDVGGLEVQLASTALVGFQQALEQLVEYPYGCGEQLASRLVPFLVVRELQGAFGLKHAGGAKGQEHIAALLGMPRDAVVPPDEVVARTVRELEALQRDDGGFQYWSSSACASPLVSAYATLALHRARELGFPVRAETLVRARSFLRERVAADKLPTCAFGGQSATPVERTMAVWTLARTGAPANASLERLFQQRAELPIFAKAMLADAHVLGRVAGASAARTQTLIQEIMNGARETARDVHFEETDGARWSAYWSSDVRTTALVLMMLVDAQPEHPFVQKAARWLQTARTAGRYRTTQDAAFALMAMSELLRAREREAPDFEARVTLGEQALVREAFKGRSLDVVARDIPMRALGAREAQLSFTKTGTGTLHYAAVLTYAKREMPITALDAGIGVQRWFEPMRVASGAGQVSAMPAGELVRVKVRVATSAERRFVAVDVPLPAGLEIVDATLSSAGQGALKAASDGEGSEDSWEEGGDGEGGDGGFDVPWDPFTHVERRDDRAVFFADVLPPGVHTASVIARATTVGTFLVKPATAEEMYAPEVSGRSTGGRFTVAAP